MKIIKNQRYPESGIFQKWFGVICDSRSSHLESTYSVLAILLHDLHLVTHFISPQSLKVGSITLPL